MSKEALRKDRGLIEKSEIAIREGRFIKAGTRMSNEEIDGLLMQ